MQFIFEQLFGGLPIHSRMFGIPPAHLNDSTKWLFWWPEPISDIADDEKNMLNVLSTTRVSKS